MKARSTRLLALTLALGLLASSALMLEAQATPDATAPAPEVTATDMVLTGTQEATPAATAEPTATVITDLTYNTAVTGYINDASPSQLWPLQAPSADRIHVRVERLDGNLLPDVQVLDATNSVVGQAYGPDRTGAAAQTNDFTLATGGQYQVKVSRKDEADGVTSGQYRLTVFADATAQDNINNTTVIGPVTNGTPVDGEITATHWYQLYTYDATAPDTLNISVRRTDGNLMPVVYVLDSNANNLTTGYTTNVGDNAEIDSYTLPSAGKYTIAVSRYSDFDGDTTGKYALNVTLIGAGEGSPSLAQTTGTVEYDQPLTGEISGAQWYQDWTLTTKAADTISVEVRRTDGTLKPTAQLLGGSSQNLTTGYVASTGDSASFDPYDLKSAGTYTIRVSRDGDQSGPTTGKYTLIVHLVGTGEDDPALKTAAGTVTTGTPVTGTLTNKHWADVWTYQATEGDQLKIAVKRTDGTLIPMIEIRDINNQVLTNGYPDPSADTSTTTYSVRATGSLSIVVLRNDKQQGQTDGGYELMVEKAPVS